MSLGSKRQTARARLDNSDVPELDDDGADWLLADWFLLESVVGGGIMCLPGVAVGVGRRSATLTTCIAPKAAVFFDRFAPGIPDCNLTQMLLVL